MTLPTSEIRPIQDIVKERLQGQIAGLIPEEAFDKMIENQFNQLMLVKNAHTDPFTGDRIEITAFDYLIRKEIFTFFTDKIKEELRRPDFQIMNVYENGEYILTNERLSQALSDAGPNLINIMISQFFGDITAKIISDIRNSRY